MTEQIDLFRNIGNFFSKNVLKHYLRTVIGIQSILSNICSPTFVVVKKYINSVSIWLNS